MTELKDFKIIFEKIQHNTSSHQRYIGILLDIYKKVSGEQFAKAFMHFLSLTVGEKIENFKYSRVVLRFMSRFCSVITQKEEVEDEQHFFLPRIVKQILQWASLNCYGLRYYCCSFVAMVLQDIPEDVCLEINIIDEIQKVMLNVMQEPKVAIRLEAMSALMRLQDPENVDCPVVSAYFVAMDSPSSSIRKSALQHIAPTVATLPKIKEKIHDVDSLVRAAAYRKCGDVGPYCLKIADKHKILSSGFEETSDFVKKAFFNYLLPKWLTAYKGNFLDFVKALKLIADEQDLDNMKQLSKFLIKYFFQKHPINDLIAVLPVENGLIKTEDLNNELTLFWNILVDIFRESEGMEENLKNILPELTPFCHYIERVAEARFPEPVDEWKYFEYQFDLLNLLEIAENFDFSDEVGRRTMRALVFSLLQKHSFTYKLTRKLICIGDKCSSSIDFLTNDICQVISEINEPLSEQPLSADQIIERDFKVAELKVKINVMKEQQIVAINARDYQNAQVLENELLACNKQLQKFQEQTSVEHVKTKKNDPETLCRCLDILNGVLSLPSVTKLTSSLITYRNQFLVPLITYQNAEIHWRVLKCLILMSLIHKPTAEEYAKIICIPIATYRSVPNNNASSLMESICGVTDLIRCYGIEIVIDGCRPTRNDSVNQSLTKRKLYSNDNENLSINENNEQMTMSYVLEIFLDMLDDEREEIRSKAVTAVACFVDMKTPITSSMLSRIILKWFSPLTEKYDQRVQAFLGMSIEKYVNFKNSSEIVKEAIVPTLSSIANAPRSSPLSDIQIENLLAFFGEICNTLLDKHDVGVLALDICMQISEQPNGRVVIPLLKLLCYLNINQDNDEMLMEIVDRAKLLLEVIKDKMRIKYVEKFLQRYNEPDSGGTSIKSASDTRDENHINTNEEQSQDAPIAEEGTVNPPESGEKSIQTKRKKRRSGRKSSVGEQHAVIDDQMIKNEQRLLPVMESNLEINNLSISLSPDESQTLKNSCFSTRNGARIVVSETSDSDIGSEYGGKRRSERILKKRII